MESWRFRYEANIKYCCQVVQHQLVVGESGLYLPVVNLLPRLLMNQGGKLIPTVTGMCDGLVWAGSDDWRQ